MPQSCCVSVLMVVTAEVITNYRDTQIIQYRMCSANSLKKKAFYLDLKSFHFMPKAVDNLSMLAVVLS